MSKSKSRMNIVMTHFRTIQSRESLKRMLKSEISDLMTDPKRLEDNFRSNTTRRVELPLPGATRKMVSCIRATAHFDMPTRKVLNYVADIPDSLKITHGWNEFLYYDSGSHYRKKLLIFPIKSNLSVLEDSERWYCDNTFSTSVEVFLSIIYNSC